MLIFLTGTHGAGKTTLAETVAKECHMTFFASKAGEVHKQFGVQGGDQIDDYDLRLKIQQAIYNSWVEQYNEARRIGNGIFDRCPVDFAAYLLSEAGRALTKEQSQKTIWYINHCMKTANLLQNLLLVLPHEASLSIRGAEKPNSDNTAYAQHIHLLIAGLLWQFETNAEVISGKTVQQRVMEISSFMSDRFEAASNSKTSSPISMRQHYDG